MLFDQRTRNALREAGVDDETLRAVEERAAEEAARTAREAADFLGGGPDDPPRTVYSDMDLTHSSDEFPEHDLRYVDLFTHSQDVRGFVRFGTWGAYAEGARVLDGEVVELTLGPTVNGRVRFAHTREALE
jgi:hypothetical protein